MEPTDIQKEIINSNGNIVVIASPGSGKTFVLSEMIKKNLKDKNVLPYQGIIAISYTRKASQNIKTKATNEGINIKNSYFGTIDSFCLTQIIKEFGSHILGHPRKDMEIKSLKDLPDEEKGKYLWIQDKRTNYGNINESQIKQLNDLYLLGYIFVETLEILALFIMKKSLACRRYLTSRFKTIYIDEFQDADTFTNDILDLLISLGLRGVVVGDEKQSIFGFNNKSNQYLTNLKNNPNFKKFELKQNFRCAISIINYSERLLNSNARIINTNENGMCHINIEGNETKISEYIDSKIGNICRHFRVKELSEVAILAKNKHTLKRINEILQTPHRYIETTDLDLDLNLHSRLYSLLLSYYFDDKMTLSEIINNFTDYDKMPIIVKKKIINYSKQIRQIEENRITELKPMFKGIGAILFPNMNIGKSERYLEETFNNNLLIDTYKPINKNEIQMMTLHKSKGLEFDIVFHLNMNEWEFPEKKPQNNDFNQVYYKDYEQDLNLHYVGITRAKKACCLISNTKRTNGKGDTKNSKPSEFLSLNQLEQLRENKTYNGNGASY